MRPSTRNCFEAAVTPNRALQRSAGFALFAVAMLAASSAADGKGTTFSRREVCQLVDAALTAPWGPEEGGLANYSCVQRNATEGSRLLVDIVVESVAGRETRPLRPGETCGRYQQFRAGKKGEGVVFVSVSLSSISPGSIRFRAGLGGIQYDERGKESGTIGIGCGAGNEGILVKKDGRWAESRSTSR